MVWAFGMHSVHSLFAQVEERDGSLAEGVDEHRTDNYLNLLANVTA